MKPLGHSKDSSTPGNLVVCGLSPAMRLTLSTRKPLFHPPLPILGLWLNEEKQRYPGAWVGTPSGGGEG